MSKAMHTPGPLHVVTSNSWPFDISICDAQGSVVDVLRLPAHSTTHKTFADALNYRGIDHSEAGRCREANQRALADAHLRAAAPELLEALQKMLDVWEHGGIATYPIGEARAAISKATGGQQ